MSTYQPGIPTGTVNLDVDYQNIQNNFQQLDTTFGVDHVTYSNQTAQNGYHTSIHFNPVSTTSTNPPNNQPPVIPSAVAGYGQLFSAQVNDGVNNDESLYFLTGGGRLQQLTRNFAPVKANNGYTFLPGGLIMQWGVSTSVSSSSGSTITFPIAFPNAVYNISATIQTDDNSTIRFSLLNDPTLTKFTTTQTSTSHFKKLYWTAIGS